MNNKPDAGEISRTRCWWNHAKRVRAGASTLGLLLTLQWPACGAAAARGEEGGNVGKIAETLRAAGAGLEGYRIHARETNVTFTQHGTLQFIASHARSNLSAKAAAEVDSILKGLPKVATSICAYTYRFGSGVALTEAVVEDSQANTKVERRILATSEYLLEKRTGLRARADGKPNIPHGFVRRRAEGGAGGWPVYLSRGTLGELVSSSVGATCATEISGGEKRYVVTLPAPTNVAVAWTLVLTARDLRPVELAGHLPGGALYSRTILDFEGGQTVCRSATSEQFRDGHLYRRTAWVLESIEKHAPPPAGDLDAFFAPLTAVSDHRFSPPLDYMVAGRLPNGIEIERMLTNGHGVARFEAVTLRRDAVPPPQVTPRHQAVRRVLMVLLLISTTVALAMVYRSLKQKSRV